MRTILDNGEIRVLVNGFSIKSDPKTVYIVYGHHEGPILLYAAEVKLIAEAVKKDQEN